MDGRSTHAAVVLAAGGSRRLGVPKQLLIRQGETLLHRTVRLAAETRPSVLVVVLGAHSLRMRAEIVDIPHQPVDNHFWKSGLTGSLRAAGPHVAQLASVLVLLCDQPALSRKHLETLLEGARTLASQCAATEHGGEPGVPAVVPGRWFSSLGRGGGDRGFRSMLREVGLGKIYRMEAGELRVDIDTAEDLAEAVKAGLVDPMQNLDLGRVT